jgi:hypothetical protein
VICRQRLPVHWFAAACVYRAESRSSTTGWKGRTFKRENTPTDQHSRTLLKENSTGENIQTS